MGSYAQDPENPVNAVEIIKLNREQVSQLDN